jgi:hypothetical protein
LKIILKKEKALQLKAKGLELASSPDWSTDRTFIYQFYFQTAVKKFLRTSKIYMDPIYFAEDTGK